MLSCMIFSTSWCYALTLKQGSQYRTVPVRIYRTGKQTDTFNPPCFVPEKIPAVSANFEQYQLVQKKGFFFFFLSFVIFEFLLGQNGNLFALTY